MLQTLKFGCSWIKKKHFFFVSFTYETKYNSELTHICSNSNRVNIVLPNPLWVTEQCSCFRKRSRCFKGKHKYWFSWTKKFSFPATVLLYFKMSEVVRRVLKADWPHRFLFESIVLWVVVCVPVNLVSLWCGLAAPPYVHEDQVKQNKTKIVFLASFIFFCFFLFFSVH